MAYRRRSCVAGQFYPSSSGECRSKLASYTDYEFNATSHTGPSRGGIVPHAGWVFSGATAGKVFASIKQLGIPKTFIVFGAVHRFGAGIPVIMSSGSWETPLGDLEIDSSLAGRLLESAGCPVSDNPGAHEYEHSIEVQMPFIKYLFPEARVVPVLAPPGANSIAVGEAAGKLAAGGPAGEIVAIGSTDLTHYGREYGFAPQGEGENALKWVREVNDRSFIDLAIEMKATEMAADARGNHNACGAGAAAAAAAAAKAAGAQHGVLLEYTTSHDVMPRGKPSMFVGYAGILF